MDQVLAIKKVQDKIKESLQEKAFEDKGTVACFLEEIYEDLNVFLNQGVDFKIVVDSLDDSILVSNYEGRVLYANPAYETNTGISPDEIVGKKIGDIVKEGRLFTGGATLDVIETKRKAFRLSTTYKTTPPRVGYAVGVPIFNDQNDLHQVVVSSRPILTLKALKEDFEQFLKEANALTSKVRILENSETSALSSNIVGSSKPLQNVWELIDRVASTDATVLITGESGVGKEVVADEIYRKSPRQDKPFIKVNCASIPINLLESELFGYEKGAFSGASASGKQGLFEMANRGTLLMDEIGDMPLDLQAKLLRAIQTKEITRVGGTKPIPLDIRFIAATNCDLKEKIKEGNFRQDLYYRLSVIPIQIPPLRDRLSDLEQLSKYFLSTFSKKHNRKINLEQRQIDMMKLYDWPGNIRELENVIEYLTICSSGSGKVDDEMLKGLLNISKGQDINTDHHSLAESVEIHEKNKIEQALRTSKNLRDAGKILGVNASTVSRKIKQYEIQYPPAKDI